MTLVVAKKVDNNLIMVGDTKLTYEHIDRNRPSDGTVKIIKLSQTIALAYAGNPDFAEDALKEIGASTDISFVESVLLKHHVENNGATDFILAIGAESATLTVIKNLEVNECENAWIGSASGFRSFQMSFLSYEPAEKDASQGTNIKITQLPETNNQLTRDTYSKMFIAMSKVVDNPDVPEVGGFVIPIVFENNEFRYPLYLQIFRNPIDISAEVPNGGRSTVSFGTVEDGAFAVNFSGGNSFELAIHFPHGNVGLLYTRQSYGLLNPTIYEQYDEIEFCEMLTSNSTVRLDVHMHHNAINYALKAENEFHNHNYEKALTRINQAIVESSKSWGPNPNKAQIYTSLQECIDSKGSACNPPILNSRF